MKHSQRANEGFLQIDHTDSPGLTPKTWHGPVRPRGIVPHVGKGQNYQTATVRCTQCHAIGVLNPDRGQQQNYCAKCHGYHCDACMVTQTYGDCFTLDARFDQMCKEAELLIHI